MMPLIDVVGIEQEATCGEAIRVAREQSHKRLPVYAQRVDRIVGVLDTLELLGTDREMKIKQFIKPADYVPGSKSIQALLREMQRDHQLLSVVVDEFGGAEGIITLEDIVEEIVEDITDEFDVHEKPVQWVRRLGENDYLVSGRIDPGSFADELGISLPEGVYASLAGFLLERVRDVPAAGTVVRYDNITFTVERASARVIEVVRVQW
jgi:CBS domain containing-hemolysin-like protein